MGDCQTAQGQNLACCLFFLKLSSKKCLSMVDFVLQQQSWVVTRDIMIHIALTSYRETLLIPFLDHVMTRIRHASSNFPYQPMWYISFYDKTFISHLWIHAFQGKSALRGNSYINLVSLMILSIECSLNIKNILKCINKCIFISKYNYSILYVFYILLCLLFSYHYCIMRISPKSYTLLIIM